MAAAEALYHTAQPAPFSLFTIGTLNGSRPVFAITLPRLLSFLFDSQPDRQEASNDRTSKAAKP